MDNPITYEECFTVRFNDADRLSRATPMAIYSYLQETAVLHSENRGLASAELRERNYAWVLNRIHMRIDRYPRWQETVTIRTWGNTLTGLYAIREFEILDENGERCGVATSRWVLIDTARSRPIRMPDEIEKRYGVKPERALNDPFPRPVEIEHGDVQRDFHVRLSDLDTNQHTNSAVYVDWCLEAVPTEVHTTMAVHSIEVVYKRETVLGDSLRSVGAPADDDALDRRVFLHAIRTQPDGATVALGRSIWVPDAESTAAPTGISRRS